MSDHLRRRVIWARAVLGYLCLLTIFSSFLTCVHDSLQEKRCRYDMAQLLSEKVQLQREVSVARARVEHLRRLDRLEELCKKSLLPLGPPQLPPLVLSVSPDKPAKREGVKNPTRNDHDFVDIALVTRSKLR